MDNHEFEQELQRLLKQDFSAGTEAFRDALLARCLKELNRADRGDDDFRAFEIPDENLEMLAAAGDVYVNPENR